MGVAGAYHGGMQKEFEQEDKRTMQAEVTFTMFSVRIAEMKTPWLENRLELEETLSKMENNIGSWLDVSSNLELANELLSKMHHNMSILKEAEANPNHKLYALHDRYVKHNLAENSVKVSQAKLQAFQNENEKWIHLFQRYLFGNPLSQVSTWLAELKTFNIGTRASIQIKDFLSSAGQANLLEQMEKDEERFCASLEKMRQNLVACAQLLAHYFNLSQLYPSSYKQENRNSLFVKWCSELMQDFTEKKCQDIRNDFSARFVEENPDRQMRRKHFLNLNFQMESWTQELNFKLQNIFQVMMKKQIDTSSSAVSDLTEAKIELQKYLSSESRIFKGHMTKFVIEEISSQCQNMHNWEELALNTLEGFLQTTNSEGDQYLIDDLKMENAVLHQVLDTSDFLGLFDMSKSLAKKSLDLLKDLFEQMDNFNSSFYGVLLGEGIKLFQREDQSGNIHV